MNDFTRRFVDGFREFIKQPRGPYFDDVGTPPSSATQPWLLVREVEWACSVCRRRVVENDELCACHGACRLECCDSQPNDNQGGAPPE